MKIPRWFDENISALKGKTLTNVYVDAEGECISFETTDGDCYFMEHDQNCCEEVHIEEIAGDLDWLIGSPILLAEERTNNDNPLPQSEESFTWTFYEIATLQGAVTIRWYGSSNGYYSESVSFKRLNK